MGFLTTHVLDTAHGVPAKGMAIRLYRIDGSELQLIKQVTTNDDGRCDSPILPESEFVLGQYQLEFEVGDYFRNLGIELAEPAFLDMVPLRFGIADADDHYHVPLLASPYSFSTYRGS